MEQLAGGRPRTGEARPRASACSRRWRLLCLIELLYATGLRVSELVGLSRPGGHGGEGFHPGQGQGRAGAAGAGLRPARAALDAYLAALAKSGQAGVEMAVSLLGRCRPPDPAAFRHRTQGAGARGGACRRKALPACAAPRLCQPSPGGRGRSPRRAADAGPRRHFDDPDLHPCAGRPPDARWWRPTIPSPRKVDFRSADGQFPRRT